MKVLKKGNGAKGWSTETTCTGSGNGGGGCGAKLLVEKDDLYETVSCALHETDYHVTFMCPECRVETDLRGCSIRSGALPSKKAWLETHGKDV